jgi:hypothetical protein
LLPLHSILKLLKIFDWWTGEDSNLRSPQGAADLQSAGFSHSPTRPNFFCRCRRLNRFNSLCRDVLARESEQRYPETQKGLVSRDTSPFIFPSRIRSASSPRNFLVELAEGIEPPTL